MKKFRVSAHGYETYTWFEVVFTRIESSFVEFNVFFIDTAVSPEPIHHLFMEGSIKWDSCSNFRFIPEEGYTHFCGVNHFIMMNKMIEFLWKKARELYSEKFSSSDFDEWDNDDIAMIIDEIKED